MTENKELGKIKVRRRGQMAKQRKVSKKTKKRPTLLERLPKTHLEYLELKLKLTQVCIDERHDLGMIAQAERIRQDIKNHK